jgi:hypothetical protein
MKDMRDKSQEVLEKALEDLQKIQQKLVERAVKYDEASMSEQVCNCTKTMIEVVKTLVAI